MFSKLYDSSKRFIKENYKFLLLYIIIFVILTWPLPYYISTGGGIIDVNSRVSIENESTSKGSFNLAYVAQIKATVPTLLLSYIFPSWDVVKESEIKLDDTESIKDVKFRDKLFLSIANQTATEVAYKAAGKEYSIKDEKTYVIYIAPEAITSLKVGDEISGIDGKKIKNIEDLENILAGYNYQDKIVVDIIRNNKKTTADIILRNVEGEKELGISLSKEIIYATKPKLSFSFNNSESGPSGGLLLTLEIYDKLIPDDLTRGRTIVGTGTIDENGVVGSIGGVSYKLKGAVSKGADIFLVPNGENYDECIKLQEKHKYKIQIIGVSTFEEALKALEK